MTQQAKVLIAESGSGYGGSAKYLASLLPILDIMRFSVEVTYCGRGPFVSAAEKKGTIVHYQPSWRFPWHENRLLGVFQLAVLVPLIAWWLKRRKIQLVHLNNEIISHLPLLLAARLAGCKILCHLHGWRPMIRTERWFAHYVDEFVTISEAGAKFFNGQLVNRKVIAISNGLLVNGELEGLKEKRARERALLQINPETKVVAMVGRIVPWKGHKVYLKALAKMIQKNQNVLGVVLGHDPTPDQEHLKELQSLARELGIESQVRFLPWLEDVWSIYAAADMVVHASTNPEPFGLVILEAMFAGRPVIATRGGGVTDLIIDNQTGLLVEPNNANELAQAIERLISDSQLADHLAEQARSRAQTCFTMERNAAKVTEVYQELLDNPRKEKTRGPVTKRNLSLGLKQTILNTGALRLIRHSVSSKVPILMYHRVSAENDPFFPAVSEKTFRKQMAYIKRCYQVLSMDELVECWRADRKVPNNSVVVTFDDGDARTQSLVCPILEELEIPATLFLATDPIDKNNFIWNDLLHWRLKLTRVNRIAVQVDGYVGEWSLNSLRERLRAVGELSAWLKTLENSQRKMAIEQLESELGVKRSELPEDWLLSWDQVKTMCRNYLKFGAHTATHPILSRMSADEAWHEIIESKWRIEEMLGQKVRHFAYPNGELGDFTEEHEKLVAKAGFDSACSAILGLNDYQSNRYALHRVYASEEPLSNFASRLVGLGG